MIKQYTPKGVLLYSNRMVNGIKDGDNIVNYKNGKQRIIAEDKNGVRTKELIYFKNGKIKKDIKCEEISKKCVVKIYDKTGELKKSYDSGFKGYGTVIYK